MSESFLNECLSILSRTPIVVDSMLRGLPDAWTTANEGLETWSPYDVVGHLIHGEKTDWIPRVETILARGESVPFTPFDRFAHSRDSVDKPLEQLLDEFAALRKANIVKIESLSISDGQLALTGIHPEFGRVTLKQLIATWVTHDLNHLNQINRVMSIRYKEAVGPWIKYLSILQVRTLKTT